MEINKASEHQLMATHYDITMGNDVARDTVKLTKEVILHEYILSMLRVTLFSMYHLSVKQLNNCIIRSYRDVIVVNNTATRRTNKA